MKKIPMRTLLFRVGAVLLLAVIAYSMTIIGRGHTVYMDSKRLEYNGQTYETPYKVEVYVNDEQVAKLYDKERGMSIWIGQKFSMTLEITQEKGGAEETQEVSLTLPRKMDGIILNLPALLAGLPEEAYLSEFVAAPSEEEAPSDEGITDEFGLSTTEELPAE
ncbi:DUF6672 family protein [Oscillibacter sp. GMB15532]|uniref:DUF6672 family protein n=1 Tax=Oscillibacter sp. GMB15532 TaxID=3230022 RepID=UPI0034DECC42